jgi:nitrite reductase/ring-hydroxylating ferredoxin subunit
MVPMAANSGSLTRVGIYRRPVRASLERVWENVLDWEHLPWLHRSQFAAIHRQDAGDWGWRARLALQPAEPARELLLELVVERDARRYVARTLEGAGKGSEIWTQLDVRGPRCTGVEVEFFVPGVAPGSRDALGTLYRQLYRALWDEDEAMMLRREAAPEPPQALSAAPPLGLGPLDALRPRLPLLLEFGGRRFRLLELDGELVAHTTTCPHWRGPLEAAELRDGCITCPWHGYRFDLRSGRSSDGRGLRLARAPQVRVDPASGEVWLVGR